MVCHGHCIVLSLLLIVLLLVQGGLTRPINSNDFDSRVHKSKILILAFSLAGPRCEIHYPCVIGQLTLYALFANYLNHPCFTLTEFSSQLSNALLNTSNNIWYKQQTEITQILIFNKGKIVLL